MIRATTRFVLFALGNGKVHRKDTLNEHWLRADPENLCCTRGIKARSQNP